MENRKRNIQMKFYVTEEEKRLIDEKMKQLPIKQYGAYFRKMAIDGYILVVDRSDTKAYIRELQAVSRNINQIAKRANATGTVYRQDIEDIKKAESALKEYESKLGLLERFAQTEQVLARIDAALAELGEQYRGDRTIQTQLASIRKTAHRLGE